MRLQEIMTKDVITAHPDDSIAIVARLMRTHQIGCVVLVSEGKIQGIVTDRDLSVRCLADVHIADRCLVHHHMSAPVVTARPDMTIHEAAQIMNSKHLRRLPVVEGEQLVGIVSSSDLGEVLGDPLRDQLTGVGTSRRNPDSQRATAGITNQAWGGFPEVYG